MRCANIPPPFGNGKLAQPCPKGGEHTMKTAEEIIAYLEAKLAEAHELYDQAKGKNAQEAFAHLLTATTLTHILEEIKNQ